MDYFWEHVFAGEVRGGVMAPLFIFRPENKLFVFTYLKKFTVLSNKKKKKGNGEIMVNT